ncbi:Img2 domain-containing protein [Rhizoctonia solani AG-1 IA]|uniref:Img2 domain-containing protein n=1 Tax=Thanatephorus cucumeris (strain AG1-IA) TaxID=983506 RepID=L8WVZ6_THACA|nr:Img2 domain-containing protein [Rhizoctonia solani AG-1 IA]
MIAKQVKDSASSKSQHKSTGYSEHSSVVFPSAGGHFHVQLTQPSHGYILSQRLAKLTHNWPALPIIMFSTLIRRTAVSASSSSSAGPATKITEVKYPYFVTRQSTSGRLPVYNEFRAGTKATTLIRNVDGNAGSDMGSMWKFKVHGATLSPTGLSLGGFRYTGLVWGRVLASPHDNLDFMCLKFSTMDCYHNLNRLVEWPKQSDGSHVSRQLVGFELGLGLIGCFACYSSMYVYVLDRAFTGSSGTIGRQGHIHLLLSSSPNLQRQEACACQMDGPAYRNRPRIETGKPTEVPEMHNHEVTRPLKPIIELVQVPEM